MNTNYKFSFFNTLKATKTLSFGLLFTFILSLITFTNSFAATRTFSTAGNFSLATNWTGSTPPVAGDLIVINANCTVDNSGGLSYGNITINAGKTLSWPAAGAANLIIANITNNGTVDMTNGGKITITTAAATTVGTFIPGTGTIEIQATLTIAAAATTFNNLIINGSGITVTLGANTVVNNNLNITAGTLATAAFNLSIAGSFSNAGTFTASTGSTLIFNGASNSIVSGSGTYTVKNVTLNMGSKTTVLDIQSANFITGINTGAVYNFTFTQGTWKQNNTATLTDCHNNGTATALTIPFNVIIEADAGTMNLCRAGTNGNVILSGKLLINGGAVTVQIGQVVGAALDLRYKVNGGTPQLYVTSGSLDCGGGFNANANTDYIDFYMSGGFIHICDNGPTVGPSFYLQNVTGGSTVMTGGLISVEDACTSSAPDIDFGGPNVSPFSVTGGTLELGFAGSIAGSTFFGFQYYSSTNYPNITYNAGVAKNIGPVNSDGQNFNCLSLNVGPLMVFDLTPASPDPDITFLSSNGTFALNITGTFTLGSSNLFFKGNGVNQYITGSSSSYSWNDMTVNMTAGNTTTVDPLITSLSVKNYTQTQGNYVAPANFNVSGNWTHDNGTFTPGTNTVTFNGAGAQAIQGTGISETFYNVIVNKSNTLTAGGSKQTITTHDLTETAGNINFTGLTAPSVLNINGSYLLTAGTFTAPVATNVDVNWTKNGGTFTPGTNTVIFNGSSAQIINGAQATTFYNLTINNSLASAGGVTLSVSPGAATKVSNTLMMTSGLINDDATNIMWLQNGATTTEGNANSYINGPMNFDTKANGTPVMLSFPIGKGTDWRPVDLTVKHTNNTTFTYNAEMFVTSAMGLGWTLPATVDTVSFIRYWDIGRYSSYPATTSNSNISGNQTVQLFFGAGDGVLDGSKLTICKNVGGASTWVDIGGTGAPAYAAGAELTGSVISTSSPTAFTSYSRFTLGSLKTGWNPLPIELLNFTATPCNTNVCLNWATASETNNDYFTVEKSIDALQYSFVNRQPGAGNSLSIREYNAIDTNPFEGISYYRLKQTDFNGAYKYSDVKQVDFEKTTSASFNAYPNPSDGNAIHIVFGAYKQEQVEIEIYDFTGKQCFSKTILAESDGENTTTVVPSQILATGIYLINLRTEQGSYTKKLIVN